MKRTWTYPKRILLTMKPQLAGTAMGKQQTSCTPSKTKSFPQALGWILRPVRSSQPEDRPSPNPLNLVGESTVDMAMPPPPHCYRWESCWGDYFLEFPSRGEEIAGAYVPVRGWVWHPKGIETVEARTPKATIPSTLRFGRLDIFKALAHGARRGDSARD